MRSSTSRVGSYLTAVRRLRDAWPAHAEWAEVAGAMGSALLGGGSIYVCGNGGSAADAQHFVAELVGSFADRARAPLRAMALSTDASVARALANDYGYEAVFERQVRAYCRSGDVVLGISTSGRSENVIRALREGYLRDACCVGLTGSRGFGVDVAEALRYHVRVPAEITPRVQLLHGIVLHVWAEIIDSELLGVRVVATPGAVC